MIDDFLTIPKPLQETKPIMTDKVYKIPTTIDIDFLRTLKGDQGSYLNPVQDFNGNWIISQEEWNAEEFQKYKTEYSLEIQGFELITFVPKIYDSIL